MLNVAEQTPTPPSLRQDDPALLLVQESIGRLKFGDVRITIHEGRVVQVDVTERSRFTRI